VLRCRVFGLFTRFGHATFDDRRDGQHHDQRRAAVDTDIVDSDSDIDSVDIDCAQSGRLQRHACAQ
jgi:hypothetical protein